MARKGPISGTRVPVELPYAFKDNKVVSLKRPVAKFLGFDVAKLPTYNTKNKTTSGRKETTRFKKGGYKGKTIKLVFSKPQKIGDKTVNQVSIPLPKKTHLKEAYDYFNKEASSLSLDKMITPDGRSLPFTVA